MKNYLAAFNKAFESRVRLGIMSILLVNDAMDFGMLKDTLDITDGNLASHLSALDKHGYIQITKQFIGKKPNTSYKVTDLGKKAFSDHLDALEQLISRSN